MHLTGQVMNIDAYDNKYKNLIENYSISTEIVQLDNTENNIYHYCFEKNVDAIEINGILISTDSYDENSIYDIFDRIEINFNHDPVLLIKSWILKAVTKLNSSDAKRITPFKMGDKIYVPFSWKWFSKSPIFLTHTLVNLKIKLKKNANVELVYSGMMYEQEKMHSIHKGLRVGINQFQYIDSEIEDLVCNIKLPFHNPANSFFFDIDKSKGELLDYVSLSLDGHTNLSTTFEKMIFGNYINNNNYFWDNMGFEWWSIGSFEPYGGNINLSKFNNLDLEIKLLNPVSKDKIKIACMNFNIINYKNGWAFISDNIKLDYCEDTEISDSESLEIDEDKLDECVLVVEI